VVRGCRRPWTAGPVYSDIRIMTFDNYHDKADAGAVEAGGAWGRGPLTAPIVSSA